MKGERCRNTRKDVIGVFLKVWGGPLLVACWCHNCIINVLLIIDIYIYIIFYYNLLFNKGVSSTKKKKNLGILSVWEPPRYALVEKWWERKPKKRKKRKGQKRRGTKRWIRRRRKKKTTTKGAQEKEMEVEKEEPDDVYRPVTAQVKCWLNTFESILNMFVTHVWPPSFCFYFRFPRQHFRNVESRRKYFSSAAVHRVNSIPQLWPWLSDYRSPCDALTSIWGPSIYTAQRQRTDDDYDHSSVSTSSRSKKNPQVFLPVTHSASDAFIFSDPVGITDLTWNKTLNTFLHTSVENERDSYRCFSPLLTSRDTFTYARSVEVTFLPKGRWEPTCAPRRSCMFSPFTISLQFPTYWSL